MLTIGFKDINGGFYRAEVNDEDDTPAWAVGMTRLTEEQRLAELAPVPGPSKEQQRRAVLDALGCFNLTHMQKDWALLESERERLGQTQAQAYAANVTYRAFVDAQAALADIEAQP